MSKRMSKKNNEEFEDIFADGSLNDEFDDEDGLFDDEDGLFDDENFSGEYEDEGSQNLSTELSETSPSFISSMGDTVGNVTNIAKDNKLATAGILSAVGFGLWKVFGSKENDQTSQQNTNNSVPPSYEDEFLGLDDEDDSIDDFIEQNENQKINPMFTPLRFK